MIEIKPTMLWFILILLIAGCAPATLDTAERSGRDMLSARKLFEVVSGNTLELQAYDFSARVYFDRDGRLAAIDPSGEEDQGIWDIRSDDRLCLRFERWYYGDVHCYSVTTGTQPGRLNFFTENGAAYYRAALQSGNPAGLMSHHDPPGASSTYLRRTFAADSAPPPESTTTPTDRPPAATGSAETAIAGHNRATHAVRKLAGDCPGCNLAGADLKEAILEGANLQQANLRGADLRYANLKRARLQQADLGGARLNHANLPGADLRGANLDQADLSGANLLLADLSGASLNGTKLDNAYLENTKGLEEQP